MDHLRDSTPKHFQRWELGGPKIWSQATRVVAAFGFGGFLSHGEHRNHPKSAEKPWFWDHFVGLFLRNSEKGCGSSGKWMKMVINHWMEWRTIFCNKPTADICMTYAVFGLGHSATALTI
jgi:hypothetical protein